jgi:DNA-3-methyladenine glycosylase
MKLERSFYTRDAIIVVKELLGRYLVHKTPDSIIISQIVEVEAYKGPKDKVAYSYNCRHPLEWILYLKMDDLHMFFKYMVIIIVLMW